VTGSVLEGSVTGADVAELLRSPARPVEGVADLLGLLDDLTELGEVVDGLARRLEGVSGLRAGELQALVAVSEGAGHPRAVARHTRQVDEAGLATVEALVRRGLLGRHWHPASPAVGSEASLVHLTDAGRAVLAQAQGLQIRLAAAVVQQLGDVEAEKLRSTVVALGTVLAVDRPGAAGTRPVRAD
jgi:DNA-binding MarR family transcriptional regulator